MSRTRYFLVCIAVFTATLSAAQPSDKNKLIVAYVYSFAKNIEWPSPRDPFIIQVISTDEALVAEFKKLAELRMINDAPIVIQFSRSALVGEGVELVYISQEFNSMLPSIYDQINDSEVLSITNGYENQRFVMINFLSVDDLSMAFEINSANIINQNLNIHPEMVLLGGIDIDVTQLYKEAQDSLRQLESKVQKLERRYDSLSSNINESRGKIEAQSTQIGLQTKEINQKQSVITRQNDLLDSLRSVFDSSESRLDSITSVLSDSENDFVSLRKDIFDQSSLLESGNKILEEQRVLIKEQDLNIQQRESRLQEMISQVNTQRNALILLFSFSGIVVIFAILSFRAYRSRKRDAKALTKQKEELSALLNELRDTQAQLVQSEKMASLGVLTAGIAHEINNAINFVYSGIYILENKFSEIKPVITKVKNLSSKGKQLKKQVEELIKEKEEKKYTEAQEVIEQMIQNIQIGAVRTTEIVKGLRTFSRSESEEMTEVDIHQDIEVALLLLHSKHQDAFEINKVFEEGIPKISGYQGQLGQAFLNIIGNAIDAVQCKGDKARIDIQTILKKTTIEVRIKDNGMGMPQEALDKIFDPFFTTKEVGSGTGLGLSITYGIIERHGGNIQVVSSKDCGAEFIIKLPLENQ